MLLAALEQGCGVRRARFRWLVDVSEVRAGVEGVTARRADPALGTEGADRGVQVRPCMRRFTYATLALRRFPRSLIEEADQLASKLTALSEYEQWRELLRLRRKVRRMLGRMLGRLV